MIIRGLQKTTLIDYPKKVACTIFLFGCNFRCFYCHNPELVIDDGTEETKEEEVIAFLKEKKGFLDGVCISGGEPTINRDLPDFIKKIKDLGYSVKLDTNGTNPQMLKFLIDKKLVDYIAMDIKAPIGKYDSVAKIQTNMSNIQKSIEIIRNSAVDYEFRMTVPPKTFDENDFVEIANWVKGAKKFYLQPFRGIKTLDKKMQGQKADMEEIERFQNVLQKFSINSSIRK